MTIAMQAQPGGDPHARPDIGTPVGSYLLTRMMLYWRVREDRLRSLVLPPWRPSADDEGNLALGFVRVLAAHDADGRTRRPCWFAPFNWAIVNEEVGLERGATYDVFASQPADVIGWSVLWPGGPRQADFAHEEHVEDRSSGWIVSARYAFEWDAGAVVLDIAYLAGAPEHEPWEGEDCPTMVPDARLYYRSDEWWDRVYDVKTGIDRLRSVRFVASGDTWESVFDGSEELTAVVHVPFAMRDVEMLPSGQPRDPSGWQ
jgi:hypothetical protein